MQKRTLVALVSLICLAILMSPCAAAADGEEILQIEAQTVSVDPSEKAQTVSVNILISNNPGIWGMTVDVHYDPELTLTKVSSGKILNCLIPDPKDPCAPGLGSPFTLSGEASGLKDVTTNGVVLTMVFSVPAGYHEQYGIALVVEEVISIGGDVPYSVVSGGICINKFVTVSYDVGEGSKPAPASAFVREGGTVKLPSYSGVIEGYTFGGWSDGDYIYAAGKNYTVGDENTVLTAVWNEVHVTGLSLSAKKIDMYRGDESTLSATVTPKNALDKSVTWVSDRPDIAAVDSEGKVTAIAVGNAIITATSCDNEKISATCSVNVKPVLVSSITITMDDEPVSKATVVKGETLDLGVIVNPSAADDRTVTWSSSKTDVADVDGNGHVTTNGKGSATITATANDGSKKSAKITITVNPVPLDHLEFDMDNPDTLSVNNTCVLSYTVYPSNADDVAVTWSVDNKKIASVDKNGVIKGLSEGDVTVTITPKDKTKAVSWSLDVHVKALDSIYIEDTTVFIKKKVTLVPVFDPVDASYKTVTWASGDKTIATVDKNGTVTGVSPGVTTITAATAEGVEGTCTLTVDAVHPQYVSLDKTSLTLEAGKTATLKATVMPSDAFNKNVIWSSDDEDVATVDSKGKVTALSYGDTVITATTVDGNKAAACAVHVDDVPIKSVSLPKTLTVYTNTDTTKIDLKISPAISPTVVWESTDSSIAYVDKEGYVVAGSEPGEVKITVKVSNQKTTTPLSAQCALTVKGKPVESITITGLPKAVYTGDVFTLSAEVSPKDAYNDTVVWASSKPAVATVDEDSGLVTAISKGSVNITATAADGSKKVAKCTFNVIPVPVSDVKFDGENPTMLAINNTCTLAYAVYPNNAADKTVTWTTSNKKVASVDKNGVIKGLSEGEVTITVTTKDQKKTAYWTLSVEAVDLDALIIDSSMELMVKQKATLTPTFDPVDASYKDVTWKSDNTKVATVDKNGNVTGVGVGTTSITVTSKNDASKSAVCEVTVIPAKIIDITLSKEYVVLAVNKTETLKAAFQMSNAENKNLVWEVADDTVATVDQKGRITAVSEGMTIVRVTSQESYGSADPVYDECTVYVKTVSVKSVTLDVTKLAMKVDGEYALNATVGPENATWKDVIWSSSNSEVVSVDQDGNIAALKAGTAKITVMTLDGGKKATCTVTVK